MKRCFDFCSSVAGLLLLLPAFAVLALLVKAHDRGPVFFRQKRVGRHGREFVLLKFRSMRVDAEKMGGSITADGDSRITPMGRLLRKTKMDELPQLFNVAMGDMSLVGPRPEVARYVALYTDEQRQVLDLRPGITDLASIEFRREEELLAAAPDPEKFYVDYCLPKKIELNLRYARDATILKDLVIILKTLFPFLHGDGEKPSNSNASQD